MSHPLTPSLHGRLVGLDDRHRLLAIAGFRAGDNGSQIDLPSTKSATLFDDFTGGGAVNPSLWATLKGSDATCVSFAQSVAGSGPNGVARGTTGAVTTTVAGSGIQLTGGLNWLASANQLTFEARVRTSSIAGLAIFAGLCATPGTLEMPVDAETLGSNVLTAVDTDAIGFIYSTNMVTQVWTGVGVNAGTVQSVFSAAAPVAAAYSDLRVELDAAGDARFYVNSELVGKVLLPAAVAPGVVLAPVVVAYSHAAASVLVDIDWVQTSAFRV